MFVAMTFPFYDRPILFEILPINSIGEGTKKRKLWNHNMDYTTLKFIYMHFTQIDKPQKQNKKFLASDNTLTNNDRLSQLPQPFHPHHNQTPSKRTPRNRKTSVGGE
jgi:hypothetical protein